MTQSNLTFTESQAVPEGYKKTEIGIIPEDWIVEPLEKFTTFISYGFTNPMPTTVKGPYMLTAKDINGGKIQYREARQTSIDAFNKLLTSKSKPIKNDLLLTKDGTLGRLALVEDELVCINQSVAVLRPNQRIVPKFFQLLLESEYYQDQMLENAGGSTIKHIYITVVNKMLLGLPQSLVEQQKVATALSDTDALISELEKFIEKKQAIKTATMQQLLTGKTRLPEFALREDGMPKGYKDSELGKIPEDWEVYKLSDVSLIDPENLNSSTSPDYEFEYISLENVDKGVLLGTTTQIFSASPSRARRVVRSGDILISTVRPNLMSHYYFNKAQRNVVCSTGFSLARPIQSKLNGLFFYYHLFETVINKQIDKIVIGSNYPAINSNDIRNFKVMLPCLREQSFIVEILEQLDLGIEKEFIQLNKLKNIKQGMMQELLTGKTRLV